jgi:hypothetical protein
MMGVVSIDLKEFGDYEPYTTWDMQREAVWKSIWKSVWKQ